MTEPVGRPFQVISQAIHASKLSLLQLKSGRRYERRGFRKFRNVSRNRPETTNLNHQYVFRRVDISPSLHAAIGPSRIEG
jgi:hypothetical protein